MKRFLILPFLLSSLGLFGQKTAAFDEATPYPEKIIKETVDVGSRSALTLEFPYASDIRLSNAKGNQIEVYVSVTINNGENNEAYELLTERDEQRVIIGTDQERLESFFEDYSGRRHNCHSTDINVEVSIPGHMEVSVASISGSVIGELRDRPYIIKTISGDIDLSVPHGAGAELLASTISGAMYANVELEHLDGKKGLNQIVGEKIHVNINKGGETHRLETISGDVMLRAGN